MTNPAKFLGPIEMFGYLAVSFIDAYALKTHEPISVSHFGTLLAQQSGVLLTIPHMQGHLVASIFA